MRASKFIIFLPALFKGITMNKTKENRTEEIIELEESSKLLRKIDTLFQIRKRGSSFSREIKSGVYSFLIAMCFVFINMRLIASSGVLSIPSNEMYNYYAGIYLGSTVVSFISTLLVGLICNLPVIQASSLSMCNAFITMVSLESGLCYENALVISFAAAVVYLVITITPIRDILCDALPASVKSALPVCFGILVIVIALNMAIPITSFDSIPSLKQLISEGSERYLHSGYELVCKLTVLVSAILYFVFAKGKKSAVGITIVTGTIFYYIAGCIFSFDKVIGQNKLFMIWDNYGSYNITTAFESLRKYNLFMIFERGFDFSACPDPGKAALIFVTGVMMFLVMGATENAALISSMKTEMPESKKKAAYVTIALTNVAAPILGATPVTMNVASLASEKEGGKTGLSAIACSICYLISMFTWVSFALFSTYNGQTAFGHAEFNAYAQAAFGVIAAVVFCLGLSLLKNVEKCRFDHYSDACCFAITTIGTVLSMNLAIGVALGTVASMVFHVFSFQFKKLNVKSAAIAVLSLVLVILYFTAA